MPKLYPFNVKEELARLHEIATNGIPHRDTDFCRQLLAKPFTLSRRVQRADADHQSCFNYPHFLAPSELPELNVRIGNFARQLYFPSQSAWNDFLDAWTLHGGDAGLAGKLKANLALTKVSPVLDNEISHNIYDALLKVCTTTCVTAYGHKELFTLYQAESRTPFGYVMECQQPLPGSLNLRITIIKPNGAASSGSFRPMDAPVILHDSSGKYQTVFFRCLYPLFHRRDYNLESPQDPIPSDVKRINQLAIPLHQPDVSAAKAPLLGLLYAKLEPELPGCFTDASHNGVTAEVKEALSWLRDASSPLVQILASSS